MLLFLLAIISQQCDGMAALLSIQTLRFVLLKCVVKDKTGKFIKHK